MTTEVALKLSKKYESVRLYLHWPNVPTLTLKGNKYADQLVKEAAQLAKGTEDLQAVTSFGGLKLAAKESGIMKWHERWEASDRELKHPQVKIPP